MALLTEGRTALPTGTWVLDPVHSTIGFELPYLAGTFRGHFADVDAKLTADSLSGSARVASVDVKDENLAAHLQSPEFFDVERHPELTFASDSIDLADDQLKVHGEITIRGTTKPVELVGTLAGPITDGFGRERVNVQLETSVDRTEFGLNWNMPLPNGQPALQNEVKLVAELYFVQEA
jgi:polyisoprenoid-binding protein YceI